MPEAESGAVPALSAAVTGAAVAFLPRSFTHTWHVSKVLWPWSSSGLPEMAAVLATHVVNSNGNSGVVATLKPFVPAASAIVALIAFVGATFQYMRDRKSERKLRVEEGIAQSTNQLTAFPSDPDVGIGSVVAALRNLREFVAKSADPTKTETELAEILGTVAREDLDYQNARHTRFDILCLQYWTSYRAYQTENLRENLYVLDQYIGALKELDGRTGLVRSVSFGSAGMENIPSQATNSDVTLLTRLTAGYGRRLALLPPDEAREAEKRFFKATGGNNSLHEKMLLEKTHEVSLHASIG